MNSSREQGVVTPIGTMLRATTGDCDPICSGCRCGIPYFPVFYNKFMQFGSMVV